VKNTAFITGATSAAVIQYTARLLQRPEHENLLLRALRSRSSATARRHVP